MVDLYGDFSRADVPELDVIKTVNNISVAFAHLAEDCDGFECDDYAAFGRYSALYILRTFGPKTIMAMKDNYEAFKLAFALVCLLDGTGEMSDEKALVCQAKQRMNIDGIVGDDF